MSNAIAGPGWILAEAGIGDIAEVKDIAGPAQVAEKDDVTNQSSPNFYKEWIPTLLDGGVVTFTCNYIPGNASQGSGSGMLHLQQTRALGTWTLTPPAPLAPHVVSFTAYVTKWDPKEPYSKAAQLDIELSVTGPVTTA
jgi:Lambda phage tail tube protein, TTP